MNAGQIMSELSELGVTVRVQGRELALIAPKGALTPTLVSRVKKEKPALLISLDKFREKAGDDWEEISNDPDQLKVLTELLMIEDMRQKGICPDHYTVETVCKRCGTVPIWPGCPSEVLGCPWCFNRLMGLPMPKSSR